MITAKARIRYNHGIATQVKMNLNNIAGCRVCLYNRDPVLQPFKSEDFPAFGAPKMTMRNPSRKRSP